MCQVRYYVTARGDSPVEEFLSRVNEQIRAKTSRYIDLLLEFGPMLKRPIADKLEGKIYALRPKQARILYFFSSGREIIFVHGFLKKTDAVDRTDLEIAKRRMFDWIERFGGKV